MADVVDELLPAQKLVQRIALINRWEMKDGHFYRGSRTINAKEFEVGKKFLWERKREEWFSGATPMSVLSLIDCFFGDTPIKKLNFYIRGDHRYMSFLCFEEGKRIDYFSQSGDHDTFRSDVDSTDSFIASNYGACVSERNKERVLLHMMIAGAKESDATIITFKS